MGIRKILFYGPHFPTFYGLHADRTRQKIDHVLSLIAAVERVPAKFLKHVEGEKGLYEVRVRAGREAIRIFCFFDGDGSLILLNAFKKGSAKTPAAEIVRALKARNSYLEEKRKGRPCDE